MGPLDYVSEILELSGTKIASQNRSDHGGLETISVQKSQSFSLRRAKKIASC